MDTLWCWFFIHLFNVIEELAIWKLGLWNYWLEIESFFVSFYFLWILLKKLLQGRKASVQVWIFVCISVLIYLLPCIIEIVGWLVFLFIIPWIRLEWSLFALIKLIILLGLIQVIECWSILLDILVGCFIVIFPVFLQNILNCCFKPVFVIAFSHWLCNQNHQAVEFVSIEIKLLDVRTIVILLLLFNLPRSISVSFLHSLFSYSVQLIVVKLVLHLPVQNSNLLQRVGRIFWCHSTWSRKTIFKHLLWEWEFIFIFWFIILTIVWRCILNLVMMFLKWCLKTDKHQL